jgi:hypothetical protein
MPCRRLQRSPTSNLMTNFDRDGSTAQKTLPIVARVVRPICAGGEVHSLGVSRERRLLRRSSRSRRCSNWLTLLRCHLPPRAAGNCRSFNSRARAPRETRPAFRSLRIVAASASARASAASISASRLLSLPLPVSRPRRAKIMTLVGCHLPPRGPTAPSRFNSSAKARGEAKPAASAREWSQGRFGPGRTRPPY